MTQLQSVNPHVDDYYYQAYMLKQTDSSHMKMYTARHANSQKDGAYMPGVLPWIVAKVEQN